MGSKHELDSLRGMRNYKGVNVMRIIGGFQVLGQNVSTAIEVDELLEKTAKAIESSLPITVRDGFYCQNVGNDHNMPDKGEDGTHVREK